MSHSVEFLAGGRIRKPTPKFEAQWAVEKAWYDRHSPTWYVRVEPSTLRSQPSCRERGAQRQRTHRERASGRDDKGEPTGEPRAGRWLKSLPQETPAPSIGPERRLGLASHLGELLASRWLRLRRRTQ
jgi:hypothetical protein